jgi:hypothetical protein
LLICRLRVNPWRSNIATVLSIPASGAARPEDFKRREEGRPHVHTPERRRALKEVRVREGQAHATLVFDDARCIGSCQFGPPEELPRIKHQKAYR